jgi:PhnB protein
MAEVKPIPEGYPQLTPYLCVDGAEEAIEFYRNVFGAEERMRMPAPDGKIGHAELTIGDALIMLSDEFPDFGNQSPKTVGGTPVTLSLYVEDVDNVFQRALDAGSKQLREVEDQFYGDRTGQFEDPFGHRWSVASHIEDVSPEEMEKRTSEMMGGGEGEGGGGEGGDGGGGGGGGGGAGDGGGGGGGGGGGAGDEVSPEAMEKRASEMSGGSEGGGGDGESGGGNGEGAGGNGEGGGGNGGGGGGSGDGG